MPERVIEIHGLTKVYSMGEVEVHALAGLDLLVDVGEFLASWDHPAPANRR